MVTFLSVNMDNTILNVKSTRLKDRLCLHFHPHTIISVQNYFYLFILELRKRSVSHYNISKLLSYCFCLDLVIVYAASVTIWFTFIFLKTTKYFHSNLLDKSVKVYSYKFSASKFIMIGKFVNRKKKNMKKKKLSYISSFHC